MTYVRAWRPPSPVAPARSILRALNQVENRLAEIDHRLFLAEWAVNTGRTHSGTLRHRLARGRLLSHPELRDWCRRAQRGAISPLVRRRLELLESHALDTQLEHHPPIARADDMIARRIRKFRPRWKGRAVDLAELWDLVAHEKDSRTRREGYYASQPLFASLEPAARSLIRARNRRATELGFSSYPAARLAFDGLSLGELKRLMGPFSALGPRLSRALQERGLTDGWNPWDLVFVQRAQADRIAGAFRASDCVPAVRKGLAGWGFRGSALSFRFRRWDTPTAGLTVIGDAPRDVGVVANPRDGLVYFGVLFHEMGHGIHGRSVRGASHLLRGVGFPGFSESIGGLFESIATDAGWLATLRGMTRVEADRIRCRAYENLGLRMVELVGEIRSELRLYRDPEADLTEERRQFAHRSLGYDDHEPISWLDPYYLSPGFARHSYLLASCFDEQVLEFGLRAVGGKFWPNPRLGRWIDQTWLRPGTRDAWVPKVRTVTGRPLGPETLLRAIRRESVPSASE